MTIKADINKTINPIHHCEAPRVEKSSKYQLGLSGLAIAGLVVAVVGALGIFGIGLAASIALNVCILAVGGIITTVALAILCKSKKTDAPSSTLTASYTAAISKKEESSTQKIPLKASTLSKTEPKKQEHSNQTASTTQVKDEKKKEDPLAKLTVSELWEHINKSTVSVSQFGRNELNHRFILDVPCNKPAIHIDGRHLHANKVGDGHTTKAIVASQAPLPEDLEHFWRVIYNTGYVVIDLTTLQDIKKRKVEVYYPTETNKTLEIGSLKIRFIKKDPKTGIQQYQITDTKTNESKLALRYHCSDWIDMTAVSLSKLEALVALLNGPLKDIPFWIHCAAGIGRTGTLIAAYIIHEKIQKGEITKENFKSALAEIIPGIRKHRWGLVQTDEQFELLFNYGESLLAKL